MRISTDISALWRTRWYEYLLRFLLGGVVTVLAGLIADRFGPGIGGLFLAFPAIFPASATLISSHEEKKKARSGLAGHERGRQLAAANNGIFAGPSGVTGISQGSGGTRDR